MHVTVLVSLITVKRRQLFPPVGSLLSASQQPSRRCLHCLAPRGQAACLTKLHLVGCTYYAGWLRHAFQDPDDFSASAIGRMVRQLPPWLQLPASVQQSHSRPHDSKSQAHPMLCSRTVLHLAVVALRTQLQAFLQKPCLCCWCIVQVLTSDAAVCIAMCL